VAISLLILSSREVVAMGMCWRAEARGRAWVSTRYLTWTMGTGDPFSHRAMR